MNTDSLAVARFILAGMADMDDEDRASVFDAMRMMYCLFCGSEHPECGMCQCWNDE